MNEASKLHSDDQKVVADAAGFLGEQKPLVGKNVSTKEALSFEEDVFECHLWEDPSFFETINSFDSPAQIAFDGSKYPVGDYLDQKLIQVINENAESLFDVLTELDFSEQQKKVKMLSPKLKIALENLGALRLYRTGVDVSGLVAQGEYPFDRLSEAEKETAESFWRSSYKEKKAHFREHINNPRVKKDDYSSIKRKLKFSEGLPMQICEDRCDVQFSQRQSEWMVDLGLRELIDHRGAFPEIAEVFDSTLKLLLGYFAPYEKVKIDFFKERAFDKQIPQEFVSMHVDRDLDQKANFKPVGISLISSGEKEFPLNVAAKENNSADGEYTLMGFQMKATSQDGFRMPGKLFLSYDGGATGNSRAIHNTSNYGYGEIGRRASHGCFRLATVDQKKVKGDGYGFSNIIWSLVNPGLLDRVDKNDGHYSYFSDQTYMQREIMREISKRVTIKNYSKFKGQTGNLSPSEETEQLLRDSFDLLRSKGQIKEKSLQEMLRVMQRKASESSPKPRSIQEGQGDYGGFRVFDSEVEKRASEFSMPLYY